MNKKQHFGDKPEAQGPFEFADTFFFDIDKLSELKRFISMPIDAKKLKKPWLQNIIEQIILFYKVVVFHQDCVRMVLTLINEIATVDDDRIDTIVDVLGSKAKEEIDGKNQKKGGIKPGDDEGIKGPDRDSDEYQKIRAKSNLQDTEDLEQQARRVRSFIKTRRIRLLYYLLYNSYRISENDLVKIDKGHPMNLFLKHFNKFINNKVHFFVKAPIKDMPKDPAGELKILRDALMGQGEPLSEWEKMYLMGILMSRNAKAGSQNLLLKAGFGSNRELGKEYKMLEREIYEFALERCLMILFDHGFKINHVALKRFVDEYMVVQNKETEDRSRSRRAEDYITQMQSVYRIFKRGLFKRPIGQYAQGEKVFEYILEDAYLVRPIQILKAVPDYPEWTRKVAEVLDHKTYLVRQCGRPNIACMPEVSLGRIMHFVMSHLLLIQKILLRLASERMAAGKNTYKYTKMKSETESLFKLQDWDPTKKASKKLFNPKSAALEPIYDTDLYSMAILDSDPWDMEQKSGEDVLVGFIHPRVLSLFKYSSEDPHLNTNPKQGLIPKNVKYNDFENIVYRVFHDADNMPARIESFESVFLSWSLNQFSRWGSALRPSLRVPIMSLSQIKKYRRANIEVKQIMKRTNFGILKEKVTQHGTVSTMNYFSKLNKHLTRKQRNKNKNYINFLIQN